jgi:hypothetical protein
MPKQERNNLVDQWDARVHRQIDSVRRSRDGKARVHHHEDVAVPKFGNGRSKGWVENLS